VNRDMNLFLNRVEAKKAYSQPWARPTMLKPAGTKAEPERVDPWYVFNVCCTLFLAACVIVLIVGNK
jgi:hypothetical protein